MFTENAVRSVAENSCYAFIQFGNELKKLTSVNTDGHLRRLTKELKPKGVICAAVAL
jgi:hypothetical protein